jgi:antitoxin ParD1/3/4
MNVSLPQSLKGWLDEQVAKAGYATASEYVRQLLREERRRQLREQIDARLLKAIRSGESTPMTRKDREDIRREGRKRLAARKAR